MPWVAPLVHLSIPPRLNTRLLAWGLTPASTWWALVTWERYAKYRLTDDPVRVDCSAWTPASTVSAARGEDYRGAPRIVLDNDARWWPPPADLTGLHYGLLPECDLAPPTGSSWVTVAARDAVKLRRYEQATPADRRR